MNIMSAIWDDCFKHLKPALPKPPTAAHAIELRAAAEYGQAVSPEAREAFDWVRMQAISLDAVSQSVRDAMPAHADNIAAMEASLSDLLGDLVGFYSKGEER